MSDDMARFWRVNSYGYPNPFSSEEKPQDAWRTFLSFFDFRSYKDLKGYWASGGAPRRLSAHAVESWKSTLEEFGLLYVISRSGEITITPAGRQFRDAGERRERVEFAWIGLSLLLRYPLRGPGGGRRMRHAGSDLLLYWYLYSALLDLDNTLWWTELERVLCTVFTREAGATAVDTIRHLRKGRLVPEELPLVADRRGAFYNSLNQVIVHAGMNGLILGSSTDDAFYGESEVARRHWIRPEWRRLVEDALGGAGNECVEGGGSFVARMPASPVAEKDERAYFEYLGASVSPRRTTRADVEYVSIEGSPVAMLRERTHYVWGGAGVLAGRMQPLCQLRTSQRVILSHDLEWSYLVQAKRRTGVDGLEVEVRRGRPISDSRPLFRLIMEGDFDDGD